MTIETELSDFHKSSLMVMKVFFKTQKPNTIKYRSYRNFDNEAFIGNLCVALFIKKTNPYTLRRNDTFSLYHGTEPLSFLGPKIWELVLSEIRQSESFEITI